MRFPVIFFILLCVTLYLAVTATGQTTSEHSTQNETTIEPILCPNNCSNNGVCNTTNRECECFSGYTNKDCSVLIEPEDTREPTEEPINTQEPQETDAPSTDEPTDEPESTFEPIPTVVQNCLVTNCSNHGVCNVTHHNKTIGYECFCDDGYIGPDCATYTICPNDCNGNGFCNYTTGTPICECEPPHFGIDCALSTCPNNCTGHLEHGRCNYTTGECECFGRYMVENDCKYENCIDPTCSGNGACNIKTGKCSCDEGRYGTVCEFKRCLNNCSSIGECDIYNGTCICPPAWTGPDCSINVHVTDLQLVNSISAFIGSTFIILTAIVITVSSFFLQKKRPRKFVVISGYLMMLLDILQFIAISGLIGEHSPPDYLKFAAAFIWSNFLFDIDLRARGSTPLSSELVIEPVHGTSAELIRKMLNQKGEILFLNNFILVCIVCILTLILFGLVAAYQNSKSSEVDLEVSQTTRNALSMGLVRLALICYMGVSVSVMYEIALAFQGQIIFVTLLVSVALLVGYLLGVPLLLALILKNNKKNIDKPGLASQVGPVYEDFKKEFFLFMIVIQAKKLLMGTLIGLCQTAPLDQLVGLVIILLIYVFIVIILKPYKSKVRNVMEFVSTCIQIFIVMMLVFCTTRLVLSRGAQLVLSIIMITVLCALLFVTAMVMLRDLCNVDFVPDKLDEILFNGTGKERELSALLEESDDSETELDEIPSHTSQRRRNTINS